MNSVVSGSSLAESFVRSPPFLPLVSTTLDLLILTPEARQAPCSCPPIFLCCLAMPPDLFSCCDCLLPSRRRVPSPASARQSRWFFFLAGEPLYSGTVFFCGFSPFMPTPSSINCVTVGMSRLPLRSNLPLALLYFSLIFFDLVRCICIPFLLSLSRPIPSLRAPFIVFTRGSCRPHPHPSPSPARVFVLQGREEKL